MSTIPKNSLAALGVALAMVLVSTGCQVSYAHLAPDNSRFWISLPLAHPE